MSKKKLIPQKTNSIKNTTREPAPELNELSDKDLQQIVGGCCCCCGTDEMMMM